MKYTIIGGTVTAEGLILHKEVDGVKCPVKLHTRKRMYAQEITDYLHPDRDSKGNLIFMMPGGFPAGD